MKFLEYAKKVLKDKGYRFTQPRQSVLEILSQAEKPLNAYDIKQLAENVDTSTVYRILEVFDELGIVHFVKGAQGYRACTDFVCQHKEHCHHQFVCDNCEESQELHLEDQDFLKRVRGEFANLRIQNHYFEFGGLCNKCNK